MTLACSLPTAPPGRMSSMHWLPCWVQREGYSPTSNRPLLVQAILGCYKPICRLIKSCRWALTDCRIIMLLIVPIVLKGDSFGYSRGDRKSTRLNSSHVAISYAVFCLKRPSRPAAATLSLHDALPILQREGYSPTSNRPLLVQAILGCYKPICRLIKSCRWALTDCRIIMLLIVPIVLKGDSFGYSRGSSYWYGCDGAGDCSDRRPSRSQGVFIRCTTRGYRACTGSTGQDLGPPGRARAHDPGRGRRCPCSVGHCG